MNRRVVMFLRRFARSSRRSVAIRRRSLGIGLERLEDRSLLAVCGSWVNGELTIIGDVTNETIDIAANSGNVTLNTIALNCGGNTVPASNVEKLIIYANAGNDDIDITGVTPGAFSNAAFGLPGTIIIDGDDGNDMIAGSSFPDSIIGAAGDDTIHAGNGDDTVEGGLGTDFFDDALGNDTYIYNAAAGTDLGADHFDGAPSSGRDTLDFSNFSAHITLNMASGGSYQNVGRDAASNVTLQLYLNASHLPAIVYGSNDPAFNDEILGNALDNEIYGLGGDDFINGGTGNDTVEGGAGDDTLDAEGDDKTYIYAGAPGTNLGTDTFDGPSGDRDTLVFSNYSARISLNMGLGGSSQNVAFDASNNVLLQMVLNSNRLPTVVYGSNDPAFNDDILGNALDNEIYGLAGDDSLYGGDGDDTLYGGDGNDSLENNGFYYSYYQSGDDEYYGGDGDDTIADGEGNDTISGGDGDDVFAFFGGSTRNLGTNTLSDSGGVDTLDFSQHYVALAINIGTTGNQTVSTSLVLNLTSATSIDNVTGTSSGGSNVITGNSLDNALRGGSGSDTISGGSGDDTLLGNNGNDVLYGGDGADFLSGAWGNDWLEGGSGVDTLHGSFGTDTQKGGAGEDNVWDTIEVYIP